MINNFQGERYNINRYNSNLSVSKLYKNRNFNSLNYELYSSDNKYSNNPTNIKSLNLFSNLGNQIMNPLSSYNSGSMNYRYNNDYSSPNYPIPRLYSSNDNLIYGIPVEVHKLNNSSEKTKERFFAPTLTKPNFIKDARIIINKFEKEEENCFTINASRRPMKLFVSNIIQETINNPSDEKKDKKEKEKEKGKEKKKKEIKISKTEVELEKPPITTATKVNNHKKWLKLLQHFVKIYNFFSILKKYTKRIKKIRENKIKVMEDFIIDEVYVLRNWMLDIQGKYWKNLTKLKKFNRTFTEFDDIDQIMNDSKILNKLINIYFSNLKNKTNDMEQIPEEVQKIIYRFIKKKTYFPKNYLTFFEINRLNFDFYGSCLNNSLEQSAMILSYLLISSITVQQIFLNIQFIFKKLESYDNISLWAKYLGSIMYYLSRNTFINKLKIKNYNYFNLFNYYRCYHIRNDIIDKENNIEILLGIKKGNANEKNDKEICTQFLIDKKIIDNYLKNNSETVETFSNILYEWSMNLSKFIINRFDKENA